MLKFLHAADIHLDSPLQGLERYDGAPVEEIRLATRRALSNLVQLALDQQVDFLLIAGDLYDGDWKDYNTGLYFVSQMSRLREAGIPVVLIAGNHDAMNKMTRSLSLPDNVELLSDRHPQTASAPRLAELGVAIHGRSFARATETTNLVVDYPDRQPGAFNIGLLHTALEGAEGHANYAPCTLDDLRQKGYDYWALGHVHQRSVVCQDPPIVFSGNTQGRHIRETGVKGCYLVQVDSAGRVELALQPLDVLRWEICPVDLQNRTHPDDLLAAFGDALAVLRQQHQELPLALRVILKGDTDSHEWLTADPDRWIQQLRATAMELSSGSAWVEKVRFETSPVRKLDAEDLTDGPLGELLRYVDELRQDELSLRKLAEELHDLRQKIPEELKRGTEGLGLDDPDRMRQWLDEVQALLFHRLSRGNPL